MFRITAETCRRFTLTEVLIMSAMNVETIPETQRVRICPNSETMLNSLAHCQAEW